MSGVQLFSSNVALTGVSDRLPGPNDDTTKGYTTSSLWHYRGQLWYPVSVSAGSAVWLRLSAQQARPVDLLGATAVFAGGTVALKAGFTGPAIDVSVLISSVATPVTVNILVDGELDVPSLMAVMAKADAGSLVTVTKVYDQTGSGNHITQFGANAMPWLVFDEMLGRFTITGASTSPPHCLGNATGPVVTGNNCAMIQMGRALGSSDNAALILGSFGQYTGGGSVAMVLQSTSNGGLQTWSTTSGNNFPAQPYPTMDMGPCVAGMFSRAGGIEIFANEQASTSSANSATSYTGCVFGWDGVANGRYMAMRTIGWVLGNAAPTAAQGTAIKRSAYTLLNAAPQALDTVVWVGDSRFAGFQAIVGESIPFQARSSSVRAFKALNFGCGSRTALQMTTTTATQAVRYYQAGAKNIAVVLAGVNDYIVNGASAATTLGYLQTICGTLKAAGFYVLLVAELDASNAGQHAFLDALRALILSAGTSGMNADEIKDVSGLPPVTSTTNSATGYVDGLHPSNALSGMIGAVIQTRVDELLSAP